VNIVNPSKAMIALVGLICLTVLMATKAITSDAGLPIVTTIIGYAVGNGIAARKGEPVEPIIGKRPKA
jgi:presenilin-like A22 family membrane protease